MQKAVVLRWGIVVVKTIDVSPALNNDYLIMENNNMLWGCKISYGTGIYVLYFNWKVEFTSPPQTFAI